jgi:hypothetical protein
MGNGATILIEDGPKGLQRNGTDETYAFSEVTIYVRAEQLTYQRSFGQSEDSRLFGTGKLSIELCAFGHPDKSTRSCI